MSELTEGLERIRLWLMRNIPDRAAQLSPGLSRAEIDAQAHILPFKLPEEIYELYQWRDGSSGYNFLFENSEFMSLQEAVSAYCEQMGESRYDEREEAKFFEYSFPIFKLWYQGNVFYTVVPYQQGKSIIRMYDPECNDYSLRYHSLTNLILHAASWYEAAAFMEKAEDWDIDEETKCLLDIRYMAWNYLTSLITKKGVGASKICREIYQLHINSDISLPNT
ncbi:hypothetical protein [Scytonema sp. NUACC26]|uniref:hypothetical protein n=1 Tax=Scytonema sp. NUACC26 TaxID=3140176 RepID=UPI0034DBBBC1